MAKVLMASWPLLGHLYPCLAIARELRRRGHDLAFYSGERVRPLLEREGFELFPFAHLNEVQFERTMLSPDRATRWTRPLGFIGLLHRWLGETFAVQATDLEAVLATWHPDLIVSEEAIWAPSLILKEKHGTPVVVCSVTAGCLLPGRDVPLPGVGLGAPRSRAARALQQIGRATVGALATGPRRHVNDVRRAHGLEPLTTSIREAVGDVPLYLVRGCPDFDYHRQDLPPCVAYVGPLDASDGGTTNDTPAWLDGLPRDRPLVYVSEGTMSAGPPLLLAAAVKALRELDVHMVMTTGRDRDPDALDLGPRPANLTVTQWVPQRQLFARTDVVVTVGGCGTVLGALAEGVPVLAVPAEMDQPDNARRLVGAGVGLAIPRHRLTPRRLRSAVLRLLSDPSFRKCARGIADRFREYGGARHAVDLIERHLGPRRESSCAPSEPLRASSKGVCDETTTSVDATEVLY